MRILRQLGIILAFGVAGEVLAYFVPIGVPASVFGLLLMLAALAAKLLKPAHIADSADYLSANMSILFVPTSLYILESYPLIKAVLLPLLLICLVSMAFTFLVTYVTVHLCRVFSGAYRKPA